MNQAQKRGALVVGKTDQVCPQEHVHEQRTREDTGTDKVHANGRAAKHGGKDRCSGLE